MLTPVKCQKEIVSACMFFFTQFRSRDVFQGICLFFFHKLCIHMHVYVLAWRTITWSKMGKQNIPAEKIYYDQ